MIQETMNIQMYIRIAHLLSAQEVQYNYNITIEAMRIKYEKFNIIEVYEKDKK